MKKLFSLLSIALFSLLFASCMASSDGIEPTSTTAPKSGQVVSPLFADDSQFQRMATPKRGDWLAEHKEAGQTVSEYKSQKPVKKTAKRNKIVLQPLGKWPKDKMEILKDLRDFTTLYFQCTVTIKKPLALSKSHRRKRTFGYQYLTTHIMDKILYPRLPSDAICYLGITLEDLYPKPSWNFVFGQAYLSRRVAVYSLARYFVSFRGQRATKGTRKKALLRSFKVLAHETGHMFSIDHCIFYQCVINGSNSLAETDRQPLWLCPVDISKLHWNLGFDPVKRYSQLAQFLADKGFSKEAKWYKTQGEIIQKRTGQGDK